MTAESCPEHVNNGKATAEGDPGHVNYEQSTAESDPKWERCGQVVAKSGAEENHRIERRSNCIVAFDDVQELTLIALSMVHVH